ncbi:16S rRNA (cytosine(1402)-N(4))-methyltransferase RsmH [Texcoconibacillus texcoconensis]|uniref:Ribosomal RNA small subunit methyltransferase H n=1 Tax=Texcoconibacillus texcoconensis TaxID=1095777 RepID=A0A840QLE3_9BACI|nr:16S rRNA (cytosine(1402)-N(4))-methyltransferase RsmH [Texcoconibacillus texcoconensis]MBB5172181.1 16S rRNA (cytosine1402-N4)-methyltransferase [Texcoconibacillus texcoconensis]
MFDHVTVMKNELVDGISVDPNGIYIDCTLGGGGHSEEIVKRLSPEGRLIAFDQDIKAMEAAKQRLAPWSDRITYIQRNFGDLKEVIGDLEISGVDGIIFDLGVSSPQLDEAKRGFSYQHDAPLDMRMDQSQDFTAKDLVNEWSFEEVAQTIRKYGEEKFAKQIARKIEKHREQKPIETTHELVDIIKEAIPAAARRKGGHPAKRTFQAIRIAVNDELNVFKEALETGIDALNVGGRIGVITFHSLEDRICKQVFKSQSEPPPLPKDLPVIPDGYEPTLKLITRKPITASEQELAENHRAHSAKCRIAEKQKREEC